MKRAPKTRYVLMVAVMLTLLASIAAPALSTVSAASAKTELLIGFTPGASAESKQKLMSACGLEVVDEIPQIRVLVVSVPTHALPQVQAALTRNPQIEFAEENLQVAPATVPNDYWYPSEWHLATLQAPQAWDISLGDPAVVIAVLDSGVDSSHPDLAAKLLPGWNFYNNNDDTSDVYGHGTKVAGVAAAVTNNSVGVAAIAWQCRILPVRVTDTSGYTTYSLLAKGITYAADNGAKVATASFLIYDGSTLSSAAKYFMNKGGLVVAAGGNTGSAANYPDNPYIISVSATTSSDAVASFSTYGPYIDLAAPGASIYTSVKGGGYGAVSGTSFSAPLTAGLIALLFSANPSLTPAQVEQILESTALDLGEPGYDVHYGWGRVDAARALMKAVGTSPPKDSTPPNVTITYPNDGATVSDGITVIVAASDNVAVAKVELYRNGALLATDLEAPYSFYWDTNSNPNGVYTLQAKAYDTTNNKADSKSIAVTVANQARDTTPPTVTIVQPANGATVSGTVSEVVTASDDVAVAKVELYRDGALVATDLTAPYEFSWDTTMESSGAHSLRAKAYDAASNAGESATISVTVANIPKDTTPPTVSIVQPADGVSVSGMVEIQAAANDDSDISKVEFYLNGKLLATDTSAPYVYKWNTRSVKDGWQTIMVRGYDRAGNSAAASITVKVANKK